eukprot:7246197-Prymnesium_polylepis.3
MPRFVAQGGSSKKLSWGQYRWYSSSWVALTHTICTYLFPRSAPERRRHTRPTQHRQRSC